MNSLHILKTSKKRSILIVFAILLAMFLSAFSLNTVYAEEQKPIIDQDDSYIDEYMSAHVEWDPVGESTTGYVVAWKLPDGTWNFVETKETNIDIDINSAECVCKVRKKTEPENWSYEVLLKSYQHEKFDSSIPTPSIMKVSYMQDLYFYKTTIQCSKVENDSNDIYKYEFVGKWNNSVEWGYDRDPGKWEEIYDWESASYVSTDPITDVTVFPGEICEFKVRIKCFDKEDGSLKRIGAWSDPVTKFFPIPKLVLDKTNITVDFPQQVCVKVKGTFKDHPVGSCKSSDNRVVRVGPSDITVDGIFLNVIKAGTAKVTVTDMYGQSVVINVKCKELPKLPFTKKTVKLRYETRSDGMLGLVEKSVEWPPFLSSPEYFSSFSLPNSKVLMKQSPYTFYIMNVGTVWMTIHDIYGRSMKVKCIVIPVGTSVKSVSGQKRAIKVKWNMRKSKMSKKRITGYQIQYSTNKNFKSAKSLKIKKYTRTTKTIKNLKAKKKYYVRIRTYMTIGKTNYYSGWSKAKSVKTK